MISKDHYILTYFGWTPPNDKLFGEKWTITKEDGIFKLIIGKTTKEIVEKDIINAICWKNPDNEYISEKDLPNFITWEGFGWLVKECYRHSILINAVDTAPLFTKAYFIRFRNILYDLLKEKENSK